MSTVHTELVRMIERALGPDPREALIAARALQDEVGWLTERAVALARVEGWGTIGRLLRMSRQGARQKFPLALPRRRRTCGERRRPGIASG